MDEGGDGLASILSVNDEINSKMVPSSVFERVAVGDEGGGILASCSPSLFKYTECSIKLPSLVDVP